MKSWRQRCAAGRCPPGRVLLSLTAAAAVVAKQLGVGKESVRRGVVQSQVDDGQRGGASSEELAQIKALKAKVRRLEEDNADLKSATVCCRIVLNGRHHVGALAEQRVAGRVPFLDADLGQQ